MLNETFKIITMSKPTQTAFETFAVCCISMNF